MTVASKTTSLARVIDVAGGTKEGDIDLSDLAAFNLPLRSLRGHLTSMHTLAFEALAQQAPSVSFIHEFPGSVTSNLHKGVPGLSGVLIYAMKTIIYWTLGRWLFVPTEECGERHVFLATSGRYKPKDGQAAGVPLIEGMTEGMGSYGQVGSGMYSVDWDCEGPGEEADRVLKGLRQKGVGEVVWNHFTEQFEKAIKSSTT